MSRGIGFEQYVVGPKNHVARHAGTRPGGVTELQDVSEPRPFVTAVGGSNNLLRI